MPDIVDSLKKLLLSDWNDVNFVIGSKKSRFYRFTANPNDQIEIKFDLSTIDTLQGLHAYMSTLLYNNEDVIRFGLKKVSHFWGFKENSFVYYMLAPPWVRLLIVSYTLSF